MKKTFALVLALLILIGGRLWAQAPAAPTPPPQAAGIVGLVQMAAGAIKACKAKICACPLGQMLQNMAKPLNMALGGLLCPPCCPPVNPDDLKKPASSPLGACAKITQEELEAPSRRKAIQCLARFDCHWWPEAEAGLLTGLRVDRNECVRLEAAMALGTGCCCTRRVIDALAIVVAGSKKDGNPSENSERVKAAAFAALQHCLTCYKDEEEPPRPEKPPKPGPKPATGPTTGLDFKPERLTYYYEDYEQRPSAEILANARRALSSFSVSLPPTEIARDPTSGRSFQDLWTKARDPLDVATPESSPFREQMVPMAHVAPAPGLPAPTSPLAPRVRLTFKE